MSNFFALDVGDKRVGVAFASAVAKLPRPLTTLESSQAHATLPKLLAEHDVSTVVVGLPMNHRQEPTKQTEFTYRFIEDLQKMNLPIKIDTCDEAQSSMRAKAELQARKQPYKKADVDALAATYILHDYLHEQGVIK